MAHNAAARLKPGCFQGKEGANMSRPSMSIGMVPIWVAAVLALPFLPLKAQTADGTIEELKIELQKTQELLKSQQAVIEALQKRVADLEAGQARSEAAAPAQPGPIQATPSLPHSSQAPFSVFWKEGKTTFRFANAEVNLSNRLQYRWTNDTYDDPNQQANGAFAVRRFKTLITGWAYTKDLTFRLQVDWANANTSLGVLDDAWVQYDFTHGHQWFMLRAGQGKTPFGRQSIASTATDMFPDRSFVTTAFCSIRDVGLTATGQFGPSGVKDLFEYSVGVYNGGGRSVYTNADGNYQTDYRLVVSPWGSTGYDEANPNGTPSAKLSLGFEYEHNDQRVRDSKTRLYKSGSEYATKGWDLMFKYRWFTAYGEYFDRTAYDLKNLGTNSTGVNAQLGFLLIPKRLELVVGRWDYDPNTDKLNDSQKQTGIGVNWYFNGFNNKLQADYRRIDSDTSKYRSYEFRLQYQLVF
jgi:phosphate-selective porin OprO/OprP